LTTKEFLQVDLKAGKVLLAKMFKQYAEDFGPGTDDVRQRGKGHTFKGK
jgi:hypothetical protein